MKLYIFIPPSFWAIYQLCQSMPGTGQGQAGTSRDKAGTDRDTAGTNRDKQGHPGTAPFCPCLSLFVPVCPCLFLFVLVWACLSLSVFVCPCLFLYVSTFAIPAFLPLEMISTVFSSMNIVTLTLLAKATVLMHAFLTINFFSLLYFLPCFLNKSLIHSKLFYFSDFFLQRTPSSFVLVLFL